MAAGEPPAPEAPLLEVTGLTKSFVSRNRMFRPARMVVAAADIRFSVHAGETVSIVGESGCGKTTLGRMIMRLIEPDAGTIRLAGTDIWRTRGDALRQYRQQVQIVFQDPFASLNPRQTVGDAIIRGPLAFGVPLADARARAIQLLERVGLGAAALQRYPHEFSGGQRQRIAIARALSVQPRVLIADEAVSALDVSVQAQVLALLSELKREFGLTMLFITHDLRVASEISERIVVLQRGQVVEQGTTAQIFGSPQSAYTRQLLDAMPGKNLFANPGGRERIVARQA
jgi:peptide/nickel transport system ATP-binding protein